MCFGSFAMASSVSTATISPPYPTEPELQTLLAEIADDLFQSSSYRDILHLLAVAPDRDASTHQRVAQMIARHTIRLTLKHLCQRTSTLSPIMPSTPVTPTTAKTSKTSSTSHVSTVTPRVTPRPSTRVPTTAPMTSSSLRRQAPPLPLPPRPKPRSKPPLTSSTTGNKHPLSTRQQEYLQTLGLQLRARRQSCRFSLAQLHHLTKIPLQHLQAFESGQLDVLPSNPSYIWGMIRIWGNILGLDGFRLATGIPDELTSELSIASDRSTHHPPISATAMTSDKKTANPDPLSRYLTYGTLAAGTLMGMGWLAETIEPTNPTLTETPAQPSSQELKRQAGIQRAILPSDIAPPEGIRRHLRRD